MEKKRQRPNRKEISMKNNLYFTMSCIATYPTKITLPEAYFDENRKCIASKQTIMEYILEHLNECNVLDHPEWVRDVPELTEADIDYGEIVREK